MKRWLPVSMGVLLALCFLPANGLAQCGVERWSIKTGTDPDAQGVNLNSPTPTAISSLAAIATPAILPDNTRISPTETTVWVLNATLREYVRAYDSDYHMVLTDDTGHTMIAEIPSPNCVGPGSPFAAGIAHARAQFDAVLTPTTSFQTANIPVQITGIGFFDYLEGQQGVAPNGVELHPVIDIKFGPFFSLTASPASVSMVRGGTATTTVSSLISNFNSSVSLSVSGLPTGTSAAFSAVAIGAPGSGSSVLTVFAGASTPVGSYNLTVSGTGGGQTHTTNLNLTVTAGSATSQQLLGNTGFENGVSNPLPWTATAGVIDNSTFQAAHSGSWKAWLNGFGVPHTDTLQQSITIPSTATQATLSFWLHIDTTETSTTVAYDKLTVQVRNAADQALATLGNYSNLNAAVGYKLVTFDLSAFKGQSIQVYLAGIEDQGLKTSFLVDDFAVDATVSGTTGGGGATTQMLGNPGFENGLANPLPWTASGGVIDNDPTEPAHGGSWKAWLNGWGIVHTDSLAQPVTIPGTATRATLTFWIHISTTETTKTKIYDSLSIQVRDSAGTVLTTLAGYSNLNAAPGYSQVSFDLTQYRGQTIQIFLLGVEDQGLRTSFLVDDFQLNVMTP
jgi:hypothetical protein